MPEYDAVVVGSGPNGLMAAVTMAMRGRKVLVIEAQQRPGGGTRSEQLTTPGTIHDVCSTIHPLGVASPAFRALPLSDHGLEWIHPDIPAAHPLDGGRAALLHQSVAMTARTLGDDAEAYRRLMTPLVRQDLVDSLLAPIALPHAPVPLARFGLVGVRSLEGLVNGRFATDEGKALLAGLAAHSMLSLRSPITAAYGLMLGLLGHLVGWPMAKGGSQAITDSLISLLEAHGGSVECGRPIASLEEIPGAPVVMLDLTPRQFVAIAGDRMPPRYRRRLERFRYGTGVWKVDWLLDGPVPWTNLDIARSATVHIGGTAHEVIEAEEAVQEGRDPERPYVLFVQTSLFDRSRVPNGGETAWAYCHTPSGSTFDMTERIEAQVERFAPGFRDRIVERNVMGPAAMERHNANYIGGDINGGVADLRQFLARPVPSLSPWSTPIPGVYLCSSSTPPGGGVHGMCGLQAANAALKEHRS